MRAVYPKRAAMLTVAVVIRILVPALFSYCSRSCFRRRHASFLPAVFAFRHRRRAGEVESADYRVTLYPGSATIERSAQVTAGARLLGVGGLPANFDTKTLQVQADKGVRVGQI